MTLEELKKLRTQTIKAMKALNQKCIDEVRTMNDEESDQLRSLEQQLDKFDNDIKVAKEELRSNCIKVETTKEENKVNKELNNEVRAIEQYLRGVDGEELRAVNATKSADSGAIKPDYIQNEIIRRLEEVAPLFGKATRYQTVAGTLSIPQEDASNLFDFGFVGEDVEVPSHVLAFKNIKLTQHRVGAAVKLTQQLINDSEIDIVGYTIDILARRLGATLDKELVTGNATGEHFQGLKSLTVAANGIVELGGASGVALSADVLMDALHAMHPTVIEGAEFVMSRNTYNAIAKLKDGSGNYYLSIANVPNEKPQYRLFGCPVSISNAMTDTEIYLVNVREAFAVMVKKSAQLVQVSADSSNALNGTKLFVMDLYADCRLKNGQAVVRVKLANA